MSRHRAVGLVGALVAAVLALSACSVEAGPTGGVVASTGADGLVLTSPDGRRLATAGAADAVAQPTWSRDGRRVVTTDRLGPLAWDVVVRDGATAETIGSAAAARPYFFYSWRHDGERIAALGPGPQGTTLDVLDAEGAVVTRAVIDGGSVFVAWEPGGDDLLVHRDDELVLVSGDGDVTVLGTVGVDFLAPSWVPGTRDALVVVSDGDGPRLRRLDVDGPLPGDDLGEVRGRTSILVEPDGERLVVVHPTEVTRGGTVTAAAGVARPVQAVSATTEVVDLEDGTRTPVTADPTFWVEWSPDGRLLVGRGDLTTGPVTWSVWDGSGITDLVDFVPSPVFLFEYIAFADQYAEQPRLWSPDGRAFTFGGLVEGLEPGVFVVDAVNDGGASRVAGGDVGFWSPGDPTP